MPLKPIEAPIELQRVLSKALAKDRGDRYQSIKEIWPATSRACGTSQSLVRFQFELVSWKELPWKWMVAGLSLLLLTVVGFVFRESIFFRHSADHAQPMSRFHWRFFLSATLPVIRH
jgi:hypothetical protein